MSHINNNLIMMRDIKVAFGGVKALDGVDVDINEREIVALMGPNGAGKSTILKALFGIYNTNAGIIKLRGNIIHPVPHEIVHLGISFVPQGRQIFKSLTVRENLEMGGVIIKNKKAVDERIEEVIDIFPALRIKLNHKSGSLSGGQQQMLAIGRGLMTDPKLLLLDEPSLGLSPKMVKEVFMKVKEINEKRGTAIVVVEHNIKSILTIVNRAYLLDKGKIIKVDTPDNLISSGILEKVFMGHYKE